MLLDASSGLEQRSSKVTQDAHDDDKGSVACCLVLARSTRVFCDRKAGYASPAGDDAIGKMSATGVTRRAVR